MALLRGRFTSRDYDRAPWKTPEVKSVMARISLMIDPEMDRAFDAIGNLGVRMVAELRGGRSEEIVVHQPKGHPDAPLSDADLIEKMTWLLSSATKLEPKRLLDLCNRLSTAGDLAQLIESCRVENS